MPYSLRRDEKALMAGLQSVPADQKFVSDAICCGRRIPLAEFLVFRNQGYMI